MIPLVGIFYLIKDGEMESTLQIILEVFLHLLDINYFWLLYCIMGNWCDLGKKTVKSILFCIINILCDICCYNFSGASQLHPFFFRTDDALIKQNSTLPSPFSEFHVYRSHNLTRLANHKEYSLGNPKPLVFGWVYKKNFIVLQYYSVWSIKWLIIFA